MGELACSRYAHAEGARGAYRGYLWKASMAGTRIRGHTTHLRPRVDIELYLPCVLALGVEPAVAIANKAVSLAAPRGALRGIRIYVGIGGGSTHAE